MRNKRLWSDQFGDDPALVALADQVDAEARDNARLRPRRAAALELILETLEPTMHQGKITVTARGILALSAEVERLAGGPR